MPVQKLKEFLDQNGVAYERILHAEAYTAQEVAASAHIPGKEIAKTVIVEVDGRLAMVVLPASSKVRFDLLKRVTGASSVRLAEEEEFAHLFPDCDRGAMPPFGNLYGMDVYVAESLTEGETITFNACCHTELVRIAYRDFERLVKPKVVQIAVSA